MSAKVNKKELFRALKYVLVAASAGLIQFVTATVLKLILDKFLPTDATIRFITDGTIKNTFIADTVGLGLSIIWNFTINRKFTFKAASNVPLSMFLVFLFYVPFYPFQIWYIDMMEKALAPSIGQGGFFIGLITCMLINAVCEFLWQRFVVFGKKVDTNSSAIKEQNAEKNEEATPATTDNDDTADPKENNMQTGVQLYTLRKFATDEKSLAEVFARVKEMGYNVVQYSGCPAFPEKIATERIKAIADDNGIEICLTHVSEKKIFEETERTAEEHLKLGCPTVGIGAMPLEARNSEKELKRFIEKMNCAADKLSDYGLRLAYHNHAFEFKTVNGQKIIDILLESFDPRILFTMDTFWVKIGKEDPVERMRKLSGRMRDIHIKDWTDKLGFFGRFWRPFSEMRPIGSGKLDFAAIYREGEAQGVRTALIELDVSRDPYAALKSSSDYLREALSASRK